MRWLAPSGERPDWFDSKARTLGCLIRESAEGALLLMFNADTKDVDFDMPALPHGSHWDLVSRYLRRDAARFPRRGATGVRRQRQDLPIARTLERNVLGTQTRIGNG